MSKKVYRCEDCGKFSIEEINVEFIKCIFCGGKAISYTTKARKE